LCLKLLSFSSPLHCCLWWYEFLTLYLACRILSTNLFSSTLHRSLWRNKILRCINLRRFSTLNRLCLLLWTWFWATGSVITTSVRGITFFYQSDLLFNFIYILLILWLSNRSIVWCLRPNFLILNIRIRNSWLFDFWSHILILDCNIWLHKLGFFIWNCLINICFDCCCCYITLEKSSLWDPIST